MCYVIKHATLCTHVQIRNSWQVMKLEFLNRALFDESLIGKLLDVLIINWSLKITRFPWICLHWCMIISITILKQSENSTLINRLIRPKDVFLLLLTQVLKEQVLLRRILLRATDEVLKSHLFILNAGSNCVHVQVRLYVRHEPLIQPSIPSMPIAHL